MKSEPIVIVISVLGAVLGAISQAPIPAPWGLVAGAAALGIAGWVARSSVSPVAKP